MLLGPATTRARPQALVVCGDGYRLPVAPESLEERPNPP
jgi:hypothetical protein